MGRWHPYTSISLSLVQIQEGHRLSFSTDLSSTDGLNIFRPISIRYSIFIISLKKIHKKTHSHLLDKAYSDVVVWCMLINWNIYISVYLHRVDSIQFCNLHVCNAVYICIYPVLIRRKSYCGLHHSMWFRSQMALKNW